MNTETQQQSEAPQPPPLTQGRMYVEVDVSTPPEKLKDVIGRTNYNRLISTVVDGAGFWDTYNCKFEDEKITHWLKPVEQITNQVK